MWGFPLEPQSTQSNVGIRLALLLHCAWQHHYSLMLVYLTPRQCFLMLWTLSFWHRDINNQICSHNFCRKPQQARAQPSWPSRHTYSVFYSVKFLWVPVIGARSVHVTQQHRNSHPEASGCLVLSLQQPTVAAPRYSGAQGVSLSGTYFLSPPDSCSSKELRVQLRERMKQCIPTQVRNTVDFCGKSVLFQECLRL